MIYLYCERTSADFFAEPLNASSNLGFILAAAWGWLEVRKAGCQSRIDYAPPILAACVGIGSFLFHTLATRTAQLADVIPIWAFVASIVMVAIRRTRGWEIKFPRAALTIMAITLIALVFIFNGGGSRDGYNGSTQYLPALLALLGLGTLHAIRRRTTAIWAFAAAGSFALSMLFRSIDLSICTTVPIGTHFVWHILNGVTMAFLMSAVYRTKRPNTSLNGLTPTEVATRPDQGQNWNNFYI